MKLRSTLALAFLASLTALFAEQAPLRVLVVAGGCCHDYLAQKDILKNGIESRLNAVVTVDFVDINDKAFTDKKTKPVFATYKNADSFRWGNYKEPVKAGDDNSHWYEMIGIQSTAHGPQQPISIAFSDKTNPIVSGMTDWTTVNEELYNNVQILTAKGLANGTQKIPEMKDKKGKVTPAKEASSIVVWTNEFGPKKTRIFSTTIGHNNSTVEDPRYLDLVTRGLLWSVDKLGADGKPVAGYGKK
ncbi:MAG: hypothetical protein EBS64_07840 [Verrucomicrobia bacterium]|nr:hypothetical protein [Verrucomicrobiota bacterium]